MNIIKKVAAVAGLSLALAITGGLATGDAWAGDPKAGAKVFKKCKACHTLKGKNRVGPTLEGIIGRTAGTMEGFKFSADMKAAGAKGLVWNEETLAGYLKKDKKTTPKKWLGAYLGKKKAKTKMAFNGIKKDKQIEDLIAHLVAETK